MIIEFKNLSSIIDATYEGQQEFRHIYEGGEFNNFGDEYIIDINDKNFYDGSFCFKICIPYHFMYFTLKERLRR